MARTLPAKMHVTFNDVAVFLTEEECRNLNHGQLQLYMEVMNENYASLQSLGLPVPASDLLRGTEQQKWEKSPYGKDGEQLFAPLQTDKTSNGLIETISMASGPAESEESGCEPAPPSQVLKLNQKNHLASFRKAMLLDSSLKPKCLTCKGILKCYCNILKQKQKKPYVCEDCGKGYRLQMYLLLHQKSHFREHLYKCCSCEKSFEKQSVLKKHMRTHQELTRIHADSPWKATTGTALDNHQEEIRTPARAERIVLHTCQQCQAVFLSKNQLRIHSRDHKKAKTHLCLICGQMVQTFVELHEHLKGHDKPYECTVCRKVSNNRPDFIAHGREHSGGHIYKCEVCMKGYSRLCSFIKHMNVHVSQAPRISHAMPGQPSPPLQHTQEPTEVVFSGLHQKEKLDSVPLSSCPATVNVNEDAVQTLGVLNECPIEFKPFKKGKRVMCKNCKKGFRYRESLRRHRLSHRVRFSCCQCGQTFGKLIKLYIHRHSHQTHRPYVCKHCTKTFSFRSLLLLHLNTHMPSDKESRYRCAYCKKVFKSQANCVMHHKSHVYTPDQNATDTYLASFSNIQIAPFTDHRVVEKRSLQETPPAKDYVKRLCYRPCT